MAPKKALFDQPPSQEPEEIEEESSEEEEEEESEAESESEEESEVEEDKGKSKDPQIEQSSQVNKKTNTTIKKQSTTPPPPKSTSDSEEEDEEEDDDDEEEEDEEEEEEEKESEEAPHSPSASDFTIKPITPVKPATKDSTPTSKRPPEAQKDDEKDSRSKKKAKVSDEESKTQKGSAVSASGGFGRVWSEEDEIGVLQGMIDFQKQKGADPSADMGAFYDFIKGKLQAEVSNTQIYDKVRRLKKKFYTNAEKGEKGEDPIFSKPHESKTFDISKRIWGGGMMSNGIDENVNAKINNSKAKKSGNVGGFLGNVKEDVRKNAVKEVMNDDDEDDFQSKYPFLSQSFDMGSSIFEGQGSFLKENMSLIGNAKARELEGKWKKLREDEADLLVKKLTMMTEQTKLVLEGMKKR